MLVDIKFMKGERKKSRKFGVQRVTLMSQCVFHLYRIIFNFRILYCFMLAVEGILDLRFDTDSSSMKNPDHINGHNKPTSVVV